MNREEKNARISEACKSTRERHSEMRCRVYEVKVVRSKISSAQKDAVSQLFREAKWFRNYVISDIAAADPKLKSIPVSVGEAVETRDLKLLGSQIKQSICDGVKRDIRSLSSNKKSGRRVGRLKFKSVCNCVPLKQYGVTYRIDFSKNTVSVQNIRRPFTVRGLSQIPEDAEITNAVFLRKASGLYFHITVYEKQDERQDTGENVGIDFGIQRNLTLSNGESYDVHVPISDNTKRVARRTSRSFVKNGRKKSRRHHKRVHKLRQAYERENNRRKDAANKLVSQILRSYGLIGIQDEMISNWHKGWFGKQVQYSAMGAIKAKLRTNSRVIVIDRSFPSTQICPVCGCLTKHPLSEREYNCAHCGYHHPSRDVKSAQSILDEALRIVSSERRTQSLAEAGASAASPAGSGGKLSPAKREAHTL